LVSATNYRTSPRVGCLPEALEQIDEQDYQAHEQVEEDPEDLCTIMLAASSRALVPPSTSARINITAITSSSLPTSPPAFDRAFNRV